MAGETKKSSKKKKDNVVCSARDLKKGERRGSMMECAKKKQIRYYGVKKADKVALEVMYGKKVKKPKLSFPELVATARGLKYRAAKVREFIESAKKKDDEKKLKKYQDELEELKKKYAKVFKLIEQHRKAEKNK
jgi:hypothetical protein